MNDSSNSMVRAVLEFPWKFFEVQSESLVELHLEEAKRIRAQIEVAELPPMTKFPMLAWIDVYIKYLQTPAVFFGKKPHFDH